MKNTKILESKFLKRVPTDIPDYSDKTKKYQSYPKVISYSQFSKFNACPKSWELRYIKKIKRDEPSIALVFGNALHETLQYMLCLLYEKGVKAWENYDYVNEFRHCLKTEYIKSYKQYSNAHFSTQEILLEHYKDGLEIIKYIKKKRTAYFSTRNIKLIGVEIPIYYDVGKGVYLLSYLDLVFLDKRDKEITIIDIKTSTKGWNQYDKADKNKTGQLILYKEYFSKQYKVPIEKIKIEFFIVRRKINPDSEWPMKRIQEFIPPSGPIITKKVLNNFERFVQSAFTENGKYNVDFEYEAIAGIGDTNCKFCPYKDDHELCPPAKRQVMAKNTKNF